MAKRKSTSRTAAKTAALKKSPARKAAAETSAKKSAKTSAKTSGKPTARKKIKSRGRVVAPTKRSRPKQRIAISHHREEDFKADGLRAYAKYMRQAGIAFSQIYMEEALARNANIARKMYQLFRALFDPEGQANAAEMAKTIQQVITKALDKVANLDEDRILRRFLNLVLATRRTNFFQKGKSYISLKLDSLAIEELPLVVKEPTCGRRPEELTGVGEVGVWTHDDLWMPVGEDGIQVVEVPPLDSGSCKFHRFPGHALECSDAEYR